MIALNDDFGCCFARPDPMSAKAERNQNIANAFYQGGHTQTAVALAFDLSSSTVSRVVKEYENEGSM